MEIQRATLFSEIQMGHVTNQGPLLVLGPTGSNSIQGCIRRGDQCDRSRT